MFPDWTTTALLSSVLMGVVNILDSHLLSRRMPSVRAFWIMAGFSQLVYALVLFVIFPLPADVSTVPLLVAVGSGVMRAAAVSINLYHLKKEEVSRVVPIVYSYPVFVALLAVPLLGEILTALQWLAVIVVVAGAMTISVERKSAEAGTWLKRTTFFLFMASLLFAGADVTVKYALGYLSFWNASAIAALCLSVYFLSASLRPRFLRQLAGIKRKKSTFGLYACNMVLAPVAIVFSFSAMQRGPISLVSTILCSRIVFVAIYSLILSRILPGFLMAFPSLRVFAWRLVVIVLIFGGISLIYLT